MKWFDNLHDHPNYDKLMEQAKTVWGKYESRKLNSALEPAWIHAGYELVKELIDNKLEEGKCIKTGNASTQRVIFAKAH